jgi:hypothetical protein
MFTSIPVDLVVFKPVVVELFPTKRIQFYSLHISGSLHFSRSLPSNNPCSIGSCTLVLTLEGQGTQPDRIDIQQRRFHLAPRHGALHLFCHWGGRIIISAAQRLVARNLNQLAAGRLALLLALGAHAFFAQVGARRPRRQVERHDGNGVDVEVLPGVGSLGDVVRLGGWSGRWSGSAVVVNVERFVFVACASRCLGFGEGLRRQSRCFGSCGCWLVPVWLVRRVGLLPLRGGELLISGCWK